MSFVVVAILEHYFYVQLFPIVGIYCVILSLYEPNFVVEYSGTMTAEIEIRHIFVMELY